jgi:hypothetical protein
VKVSKGKVDDAALARSIILDGKTKYPYRIFFGETTKFSKEIAEGSRMP